MFVNKVPRKDFATYQCVSSERARELAEKNIDVKPGVQTTVQEVERV